MHLFFNKSALAQSTVFQQKRGGTICSFSTKAWRRKPPDPDLAKEPAGQKHHLQKADI